MVPQTCRQTPGDFVPTLEVGPQSGFALSKLVGRGRRPEASCSGSVMGPHNGTALPPNTPCRPDHTWGFCFRFLASRPFIFRSSRRVSHGGAVCECSFRSVSLPTHSFPWQILASSAQPRDRPRGGSPPTLHRASSCQRLAPTECSCSCASRKERFHQRFQSASKRAIPEQEASTE